MKPEFPAAAAPEKRDSAPVEAVEDPEPRTSRPEVSAVATPLIIVTGPLLPELVVPVLNSSVPLTPVDTALADMMATAPVEPDALPPEVMTTLPPVCEAACAVPALMLK